MVLFTGQGWFILSFYSKTLNAALKKRGGGMKSLWKETKRSEIRFDIFILRTMTLSQKTEVNWKLNVLYANVSV
jgi:hypothetical protein